MHVPYTVYTSQPMLQDITEQELDASALLPYLYSFLLRCLVTFRLRLGGCDLVSTELRNNFMVSSLFVEAQNKHQQNITHTMNT